jgi:CRP-like cAMP-binding protein
MSIDSAAAMGSRYMKTITPPEIGKLKGRLFAGLHDNVLREVACLAQPRRVAARQQLTFCGGQPDYLFFLKEGRARSYLVTEAGAEVLLLWLAPGDIIGLVSLMPNPPHYMAGTTTVSDCEFLVWEHSHLRRLAKAFPQLTENGLRLALHYLKVFVERHASMMNKNAEARLAQTLLQLSTQVGEVQPSGVVIEITNEQLSSLSDISSFTASRLLSKWERKGAVCKERGRVTVVAPEALMIP